MQTGGRFKMSGTSGQIQEDDLIKIFEKFEEVKKGVEQIPMSCDSLSLIVMRKNGKLISIGDNGIEVNVNKLYLPKPIKIFTLMYHFHT